MTPIDIITNLLNQQAEISLQNMENVTYNSDAYHYYRGEVRALREAISMFRNLEKLFI